MRDQYQVLANGRADCLIFKACHDEQPNCVAREQCGVSVLHILGIHYVSHLNIICVSRSSLNDFKYLGKDDMLLRPDGHHITF